MRLPWHLFHHVFTQNLPLTQACTLAVRLPFVQLTVALPVAPIRLKPPELESVLLKVTAAAQGGTW